MKVHPGALAATLSKAQTNGNDNADDHNSHSDVKNPEQQEEKQKLVKRENDNSTDPQPSSVASSAEDEPAVTTV